MKAYIFIHKSLLKSFYKSYIAISRSQSLCEVNPLQSSVVFSDLEFFPIRTSWEFKQFSFSLANFQHIQAMNIIIGVFLRPIPGILTSTIAPTSQVWSVLRLRTIFPCTIKKSVNIVLILLILQYKIQFKIFKEALMVLGKQVLCQKNWKGQGTSALSELYIIFKKGCF